MTRAVWRSIIASKSFYIRTYRRLCIMLIISLLFSLVLSGAICYRYFHYPEQRFYAANGLTAPVELKPLDAPNNASTPLLPPDPMMSDQTKLIPE